MGCHTTREARLHAKEDSILPQCWCGSVWLCSRDRELSQIFQSECKHEANRQPPLRLPWKLEMPAFYRTGSLRICTPVPPPPQPRSQNNCCLGKAESFPGPVYVSSARGQQWGPPPTSGRYQTCSAP